MISTLVEIFRIRSACIENHNIRDWLNFSPGPKIIIVTEILWSQVNNEGGFRAAARHVYRDQGARGFWRGNGLNVLKSSPEFAIKWSVYDYAKRRLIASRDDGHLDSLDRFAAGAVAGVCSHTFLYPIEARIYILHAH